jgi:hypothetical protein
MDNSLDSLLINPPLDPITLSLTDPQDHSRSEHRQLTSKYSLNDLYALLVSHRQGCHRHTLT